MLKNKRIVSTIALTIILITSFNTLSFGANMPFKDIDGSYAKKEIIALYNDGVLSGKGEGIFKPKDNMTRAELAKVLAISLNLEEDREFAKKFTDVPQNSWHVGYVGALAKSGITDGTSPNTFSPNKDVTREELAVFFIRALDLENKANELKIEPKFTDNKNISSWARNHIGLATEIGFITGIPNANGSFSYAPKTSAERQALAILAYKFNYNKDEYLAKVGQIVQPPKEEPKDPVDPPKPTEPKDPAPKDPTDPPKPVDPEKPIPKDPIDPPKPVEPPKEVEEDFIEIKNISGKQMAFLNSYLMNIEFDIEGNIVGKEVVVIVNEGTKNEIRLKMGAPKSYDFYFDGMVKSIDTITVYIGNEKFEITNNVNWK
ncbi:MAG: S-layer homology domain-containing protein [Tissierellia bacterium]|nr:S-layer homology domain-containing protein [Tissierellia bacterium]